MQNMRKFIAKVVALVCLFILPPTAFAQLPEPTYGWNLGNTLEPPCGEGCWGGTASQALINAVADAGFNTIRIPVAWDSHANQSTYQIDSAWMARVKQVVDWSIARNMTVVINSHWDNGWVDNYMNSVNSTTNAKLNSYWTQIANTFKNYDNRVIFAGMNEPPVDNASQMSVLFTYQQTFISAVRNTGGNNVTRWLAVQGPSTDIDKTYNLMYTLPYDPTANRLIVEVHYYSPWEFALLDSGNMFYFWGQGYHHATMTNRNATWGEEDYIEAEFQKMKQKFVDQGVPVMIGEFSVERRDDAVKYPDLTGTALDLHLASRTYYYRTLLDAAKRNGLKPINWSTTGGLFNFSTAAVVDPNSIRPLTGGAALPPPGGGGIIANGMYRLTPRHSGKALEVASVGITDGSNVQQWSYWWGDSQRWMLTHLGNNQYSVISAKSGKALDVSGWGTGDGTNVDIWAYGAGANQKWTVSDGGGGYYRLSPTHASSKCLDVSGASTADGANVQIWSCGTNTNQQWSFQSP
ncbi:cellulase family glycosylhydrolase [Hydrocarboniphaga sp.]|uniref:cellulase family glycosylhydrolase n=1 Tax=Hydrocarboniphaga sp. TaxID=2033016 RepID=UPI003D0B7DF1